MPTTIKAATAQELARQREKYIAKGYTIATQTEQSILLEGSNQGKLGSTLFAILGLALIPFAPIGSIVVWVIAALNYMLAGKKKVHITLAN